MAKIGGQVIPGKTLLLLTTELVLIVVSLLLAAAMRVFSFREWLVFVGQENNLARFVLVVIICGMALYYFDVYDLRASNRRAVLFVSLMQALGAACVLLAIIYYFQPGLALGRGVAVLATPLILILILGWRMLLESLSSLASPERLLILGTSGSGIALAKEICSRNDLNFKVVGFLDERGENIGKSLVNPGIIGSSADLETIASREKIGRIVLSLAERRGTMPVRELLHLRMAGIPVEDAHTLYERITGRILLERLSPSWLILSDGFRKSAFLLTSKRLMDIIISLLALMVSLPILVATAIAIYLEDGRPIRFRQRRVGLNGKEFTMEKFRSMHKDADKGGAKWAADGDRRITRVGRFIRKCRIDELPQFWNVLRGEMSLVGPRPEQPYFCALLENKIPYFGLRHTLRPGITGWAQIKYQYGASIDEAKNKLELDLFYIKHLSLTLDLAIIFETVKVMLVGRGAK
jgi:sugar transferase (PEP-CTERM system associated)